MYIKDKYKVYYNGDWIGMCYAYSNHKVSYSAFDSAKEYSNRKEFKDLGLDKDIDSTSKKTLCAVFDTIKDENRMPGTRKMIWQSGDLRIERVPEDIDKFWIYRRSAEKGEVGYSEKSYSVPHCEGNGPIPGMNEWASWYCFNKKDDGMYEAELDEAWWWGGGHNDGGTIRTEVPEEWLSLTYEEFLERVVTLSAAAHYGFTAEELKEKDGLKEFFGF